jgi:hypothetical protein
MFTKFGSVQEFLEAIKTTKFKFVAIPNDWKFAGQVTITGDDLTIAGVKYPIVSRVAEVKCLIIEIPGN